MRSWWDEETVRLVDEKPGVEGDMHLGDREEMRCKLHLRLELWTRLGWTFLKILFIYLAVWGIGCGILDLWSLLCCVGSLVEACGIFNCGMWTLSCNMWDLVPQLGIEPGPLHWERGVLSSGPAGKSLGWTEFFMDECG